MAYKALYRTWRPLTFDDVVGQGHITQTLKNEIAMGRVGHAYLFCGSRGTGKTSTARILSRAINCLQPKGGNPCNTCENCAGILDGTILDITEIDAASNNGVENIRELREEARFEATRLKSKVYIVDEVHMLSASAFNALLKILEEPPSHVHFILATTEAHKVPATILSRCQRFDFKRINTNDIEGQLKKILAADGFAAEERGIRLMAEKADGSMRDALSILDQCMAIGGNSLSYDDIAAFIGATDTEFLYRLAQAVASCDTAAAFLVLKEYMDAGKNAARLAEDFIQYTRNILLCKYTQNPAVALDIAEDEAETLRHLAEGLSEERIVFMLRTLSDAAVQMRYALNSRVCMEVALVKMINPVYGQGEDAMAARLGRMEDMLRSGAVAAPTSAPEKAPKKEEPKPAKKAAPPPPEGGIASAYMKMQEDIKKDLIKNGHMSVAMVLENMEVTERSGRLVLLALTNAELSSYRTMLGEENMAALKASVEKTTGIEAEIMLDKKETVEMTAADPLQNVEDF